MKDPRHQRFILANLGENLLVGQTGKQTSAAHLPNVLVKVTHSELSVVHVELMRFFGQLLFRRLSRFDCAGCYPDTAAKNEPELPLYP